MNKMTVAAALAALAAGGVAGWLAERAWGNCGNVELWNYENVEMNPLCRGGRHFHNATFAQFHIFTFSQ